MTFVLVNNHFINLDNVTEVFWTDIFKQTPSEKPVKFRVLRVMFGPGLDDSADVPEGPEADRLWKYLAVRDTMPPA